MAEGEPSGGNGPGSEDRPLIGLAGEEVGCLEVDLSTLVAGSVSLLMSLRQLADGGCRVRSSNSSGDEKVSRVKVVR